MPTPISADLNPKPPRFIDRTPLVVFCIFAAGLVLALAALLADACAVGCP